ncbi:MAG TPA: hypothetical protein VHG72_02375 [Polyangia bacterium]|nr:hypothetical protein [Polyangia bacterium]
MTTGKDRRIWLTTLLGIGALLLAADSCAASPLPGGGQPLRDRAAGYEMTVLVDGVPAATYQHEGGTYVLGQLGARYTLRVANHSGRRVEAVVSVDGRDAIDGRPADFRGKRGYLIPAWGSVDIDGWRISQSEAAAFRFSSVPESYAARTGTAREVGVIGVAIFPERYVPPPPVYYQPRPYAAPESSRLRRESEDRDSLHGMADEAAAAPATSAPKGAASGGRGAAAEAAPYDGARRAMPEKTSRPGLGTEYGEAVSSPIYEVEFVRANAARPSALLGARYNDRDGLLAMGIPIDEDTCASDADLRLSADPFPAADRRYAAPPAGWRCY